MSSSYTSYRLHIGTLMLYVEAVAWSCIIVTCGVVLVGFKPGLNDQLASFSALTLLVWSSDL